MSYSKQIWQDNNAAYPISAARLSHLEDGVAAAATAADSANTDNVKAAPGSGGVVIIREGIDTSTGAANEIIISATSAGSSSYVPIGLDMDNGQVGCSLGDPALVNPPNTTDSENNGTVTILSGANNKIFTRIKLYSDRIDKISWQIGDGSGTSVNGQVGLVNPGNGAIMAMTSMALTPATVTANFGNTVTWSLATPLTGLTALGEIVFFMQMGASAGTVRLAGRGITGISQQTALRASGSLFRCGGQSGTSQIANTDVIDLTTGWTKRPIPLVLLMRTV